MGRDVVVGMVREVAGGVGVLGGFGGRSGMETGEASGGHFGACCDGGGGPCVGGGDREGEEGRGDLHIGCLIVVVLEELDAATGEM